MNMKQMKKARKVSAGVFLGLGGLLALIAMSVGGPVRTVAADDSSTPNTVAADDSSAPGAQASVLPSIQFNMLRSLAAVAGNCLPRARGDVTVVSLGPVEQMDVDVEGLPPNTEFDFFVIQIPNAPFGMAWYQGDIETNNMGQGHRRFVGRFNIETFIVAQPPGDQPAPQVHNTLPFPDASMNPATEPIHTYHLGLWFGSPQDAQAAGCPGAVTRFNGDHNAGIQVLSTRQFPKTFGPLRQLRP
jgi:hypothetical protein